MYSNIKKVLDTGSKRWYVVLLGEHSMIKQALHQHGRTEEHQ